MCYKITLYFSFVWIIYWFCKNCNTIDFISYVVSYVRKRPLHRCYGYSRHFQLHDARNRKGCSPLQYTLDHQTILYQTLVQNWAIDIGPQIQLLYLIPAFCKPPGHLPFQNYLDKRFPTRPGKEFQVYLRIH